MTAKRSIRAALAFTLIELLVVIAMVALLVSIVLPSFWAARDAARGTVCMARQRSLAAGWHLYADDNKGIAVPGRFGKGGTNLYWVGSGWKIRPRWIATMGTAAGKLPFSDPSKTNERQDYEGDQFTCPVVPERTDERNHAFGYNYQFLGNARNKSGGWVNFPVKISYIATLAGTVLCSDALGTSAEIPADHRKAYDNDGTDLAAVGNHAWSMDPPRLTPKSDRGDGSAGGGRSSADARHRGKANVVFCDGSAKPMTLKELGYDVADDGSVSDNGNNSLFSGKGVDKDPPAIN